MTTAARPTTEASCHWYDKQGNPVYEVPKANGEGMRPTTLADARKLNLLPSVTTILGVLHKEALVQWRVEQAVLACLTSKRNDGEPLDDFVKRVLHDERVQEQESDIAKKRGTEIHDAIEGHFSGRSAVSSIMPWIEPVLEYLGDFGEVISAETILVGDGYAGRTDLIQRFCGGKRTWDFKTTKKLPKGEAWSEHRLQLSAYAAALHFEEDEEEISTGNIYISTLEAGKFVVCEHQQSWQSTYLDGFLPLLRHWQWANNYHP